MRETVLVEGEAAQTNTLRWEDYTTTAIDPSDDCTVWYVGDYLKKGAASYSTKIGAFRMRACQARRGSDDGSGVDALAAAIKANDAAAVARVLEEHPGAEGAHRRTQSLRLVRSTALLAAVQRQNREMVDVLLRAGANINQKSHWWAGGFHVMDDAWQAPWMASFLIGRGAVPEIHHVVRLGMIEDVRRIGLAKLVAREAGGPGPDLTNSPTMLSRLDGARACSSAPPPT